MLSRLPGGSRGGVLILLALVAVAVAALLVVVLPRSADASVRTVFPFAPARYKNGLVVTRTWALGGKDGDTVYGLVRVINGNADQFKGTYEEVLPKSLVDETDEIDAEPSGVKKVMSDPGHPVLRLKLDKLDPNSFAELAYEIAVPADGIDKARLRAWAQDQRQAQKDYSFSEYTDDSAIPSVLKTFEIKAPNAFQLAKGTEYQLDLVGTMDDGKPAPPLVLAGISWRSSDVDRLAVAGGKLRAIKGGAATITAEAGPLHHELAVAVVDDATEVHIVLPRATYKAPVISLDPDFEGVDSPLAGAPVGASPGTEDHDGGVAVVEPSDVGADVDGDGVPVPADLCPDDPGDAAHAGCPAPPPDTDGDLIPDPDDRCVDQQGPGTNGGCPDDDLDDDGVLDPGDRCPLEPGLAENQGCQPVQVTTDTDGDGVEDTIDACLGVAGPAANSGCPDEVQPPVDNDNDGVAEDVDDCPDVPGVAENHGCPATAAPDGDGDTVPDDVDACATVAGPPENNGCPVNAPDGDGDTVPDDIDACATVAGAPENNGCPAEESPGPEAGDTGPPVLVPGGEGTSPPVAGAPSDSPAA
jgi:hypothetical protein